MQHSACKTKVVMGMKASGILKDEGIAYFRNRISYSAQILGCSKIRMGRSLSA
jgi:hypothetical protein